MAYIALYRRYRPQGFSELVGQDAVRKTLEQAISHGRVAHAYLFAGPRGTGKTSTAKIMARLLNCENPKDGEPCGQCENCRQIADGTSMDVYEIDAASNRGIDEIRELRDTVKFAATSGRYKVYIIDEVHMLTTEAFNALLKTLEEPPEKVVFILATTEAHKVPTTIKSRCQRYDFKRIATSVIKERLFSVARQAELKVEPEAISIIAREADGGMRDALSLLDQCVTLAAGENVTEELVSRTLGIVSRDSIAAILAAISEKDAIAALDALNTVITEGKDLKQLIVALQTTLRQIMVYQAVNGKLMTENGKEENDFLARLSPLFSPEEFIPIIKTLHEVLSELRWSEEPRLAVEAALLTLAQPDWQNESALPLNQKRPSRSLPQKVPVNKENAEPIISPDFEAAASKKEEKNSPMPPPDAKKDTPSPLFSPSSNLAVSKAIETKILEAPPHIAAAPVSFVPSPKAPTSSEEEPVSFLENEESLSRPKKNDGNAADDKDEPVEITPEGQKIWDEVLARLSKESSSSLTSCVAKAQFDGLTDTFLRLKFTSEFQKQRTEKADYRKKIEAVIAEVTGKKLSLAVTTEKKRSSRRALDDSKQKAEKKQARLKAAAKEPSVAAALSLFGGYLVAADDDSPPDFPPDNISATSFPADGDIPFPDDDDAPPL